LPACHQNQLRTDLGLQTALGRSTGYRLRNDIANGSN
jgi:hypothetical protein